MSVTIYLDILSHALLCGASTYLSWRHWGGCTRWLNWNRTLYILYGALGVVAYARNERRSLMNLIYNRLHDISYVCGSALTNVHLANHIAASMPLAAKPSLFYFSVLSGGLPVFSFVYHVVLKHGHYEVTQFLCKASSILTILLGDSINSWSTAFSGILYLFAFNREVLRAQEDFYFYDRNAYNFLVMGAQLLL